MTSRLLTRLVAAGTVAVMAATLSPAPAGADHAGPAPGPVNADSTFGWGMEHRDYKFIGRLPRYWGVKGPGVVRNQHGMLTLNTAKRGSVSATLHHPGFKVGRWEIRLRSRRYETKHADYRVVTELIPAGGRDQRCGARNIVLETYALDGQFADFYVRNTPDVEFWGNKRIQIFNDRWHTFAVEVTKKHVAWFVDAHVIRKETRPEALSGVPLTYRFTMQAVPGKRMNRSRMQMDWARYYTLRKKNRKSLASPRLEQRTYADAC